MARADDFEGEASGDTGRSARTDAFWDELKIDPVEIALPSGVGFTLRAYRLSSQITPTDTSGREDDIAPADYRSRLDEDEDLEFEDAVDADSESEVEVDDDAAEEVGDEEDADETAEEDLDLVSDEEEADETADEEVPLFLSNAGNLLVFKTAESLVEFVKSGAPNDLTQLDEWGKLSSEIEVEHVVALPDDQYELDLVVNNLRGGPEAWDARLIVQSGQIARDLGYALRIEPVLLALSPGSPLDDLDEALRGVAAGGVGTFFAKRRARKVGKETSSLAWRTVIGKISTVVDWRD